MGRKLPSKPYAQLRQQLMADFAFVQEASARVSCRVAKFVLSRRNPDPILLPPNNYTPVCSGRRDLAEKAAGSLGSLQKLS